MMNHCREKPDRVRGHPRERRSQWIAQPRCRLLDTEAGPDPHPRSPIPYAAAKAGVELMTQDVAAQAGPFGVRVNCIAPETILTERNVERIPKEQQAELAALHPIARLGTGEDVARAALFLASEASAWITGIVLDVAGGATMVR
jgi:3-oxoacyl-[acyl-carrier protein] reductase